ncbi:PAS fold-containing protein [Reichenbachiella faecimaris]|uniref:PAS fold-containing protein n=1 Tax=Reichenbachiella faecimaris TaxID=692418 RepID=A0A1W2G4U2_REIFA|nr:LuxR C-terminal-related transcriptional regulator [Reichenbachiella faecimaris]SMD31709.1 PAS fold-containing protein [Reichenbachiella faecimaris]
MDSRIISDYSEIFETYQEFKGDFLESHISKLKELDRYIPHSTTFFCITNTTTRSFEYVSKNFHPSTGLDTETMCQQGMTFWWEHMHPEEMNLWLQSLNDLMAFTMSDIDVMDRKKVSYTWNYRIKTGDGTYQPILQHTTPMYFDEEGKPVIGLAHYSVLPSAASPLPIRATAKILNEKNEYETIFFKTYSEQKLITEQVTFRERDIIRLISFGYSTDDIADKLFISTNTVNSHRRNILKKTDCKNTSELVSRSIREGMI